MASGKKRQLEATIAAIQRRWGLESIRQLKQTATEIEIPCIQTGFQELDEALGIGGIPCGRITEILGMPTSGMSTLALKLITGMQHRGGTAVYVDLVRTFDPDFAARCGVDLERLYLARPESGKEALDIVLALAQSGSVGLLVFDAVPQLLREPLRTQEVSTILRQMNSVLLDSACTPVFLTPLHFGDAATTDNYPDGFALPSYASVRLLIEKERWIPKRHDIQGYRARVSILKNKLGAAGKTVTIAITFDGIVQGNGT